MKEKTCILGLDIGTTSAKVVAFDRKRRVIARAQAELQLLSENQWQAEQDPDAVYETVIAKMVQVISDVCQQGYDVQMVGFSAAMHSIFMVSEGNAPLCNALTWMDGRAHKEAEDFWQEESGRSLYRRTGTPIHAMAPLLKLMWLQKHRFPQFQRAAKFVSLKEWVWHKWFREWQIDESMASATGLFDIRRRSWDESALQRLGIASTKLSEVVSTHFLRSGCMESRLLNAGLSRETLFNIGASDGVLANLGIGAVENDTLAVTVGTSLAVRLGSRKAETHEDIRSFCYILDNEHYVIGGPSNSGGIVLDWVYRTLNTAKAASLGAFIAAAGDVAVPDLHCLPYIGGERAPLWNSEARASFVGMGLNHTPLHLLRAAIEGIVFNAYWIASELFAKVGRPTQLIASGKLFETQWVRQLVADVFSLPVQFDLASDASVLGAVELAAKAGNFGLDKSVAASGPWVEPAGSRTYERKFREFRELAAKLTEYRTSAVNSLIP